MKKSYMKLPGLILLSTLILSSCMTEGEVPQTQVNEIENEVAIDEATLDGENFRKSSKAIVYSEKFSNQSIQDPSKPYAFPGFGTGNATHVGKSYSFFNQYAQGAPDANGVVFTVAAPVTEFFSAQLTALGIDVDKLNSNYKTVSTITTDENGNSIWFHNVSTKAKFDQFGNITFDAVVEIVGGSGKFVDATGNGTVTGNVMAIDGKGNTQMEATIYYK